MQFALNIKRAERKTCVFLQGAALAPLQKTDGFIRQDTVLFFAEAQLPVVN